MGEKPLGASSPVQARDVGGLNKDGDGLRGVVFHQL